MCLYIFNGTEYARKIRHYFYEKKGKNLPVTCKCLKTVYKPFNKYISSRFKIIKYLEVRMKETIFGKSFLRDGMFELWFYTEILFL